MNRVELLKSEIYNEIYSEVVIKKYFYYLLFQNEEGEQHFRQFVFVDVRLC